MKPDTGINYAKNILKSWHSLNRSREILDQSMSRARGFTTAACQGVNPEQQKLECLRGLASGDKRLATQSISSLTCGHTSGIRPMARMGLFGNRTTGGNANPVFCGSCGARVTRAGAFCGGCGSRLTQ
jgi:hypothetical protein